MRNTTLVALILLICGCASTPEDQPRSEPVAETNGNFKVEIHSPIQDLRLTDGETWIEVQGGASTFGGTRYLDLMLVLDSSKSLKNSDPDDYRSSGASGLVRSLSPQSDILIGVVGFNKKASLLLPLTSNRAAVVETLGSLERSGGTGVDTGILSALEEFERSARKDSSRVILLFTDGKSNAKRARQAAREAQLQGVAIHTLLLGSNKKGAEILQEIAEVTGASFTQVTDPAKLPEAFLNLRTTGIANVMLQVNKARPVPARMAGGTFTRRVKLQPGRNHIVAVAVSLDGRTARSAVDIDAGPPNCAALEVVATKNGLPTISVNERAVEIVIDASRSMWGRMDGQPKMVVAKEILKDMSKWLPDDLKLALRAYGHTSPSEQIDCADSQQLVAFGGANRERIRHAIDGLRPLGQTPLAYALGQVADDFGSLRSERAVVLVTDGIESCGGDPVAVAKTLSEQDIMIHVIGFGLENAADENTASLDAVARASGGRFLTADSPEELKEALSSTVGTPLSITFNNKVVANSAIGSREPILLPEGDYRVLVNSTPPHEVAISLVSGEKVTMTLVKEEGNVSFSEQRRVVGYMPCGESGSDLSAR